MSAEQEKVVDFARRVAGIKPRDAALEGLHLVSRLKREAQDALTAHDAAPRGDARPVAWMVRTDIGILRLVRERDTAVAVALTQNTLDADRESKRGPFRVVPLYAAPPPAELRAACERAYTDGFARARATPGVLDAATREADITRAVQVVQAELGDK